MIPHMVSKKCKHKNRIGVSGTQSKPQDILQNMSTILISLKWRHLDIMTSQITANSTVCLTVCSAVHQRKHQSSASLAFLSGIYRWKKCFHLMMSSWWFLFSVCQNFLSVSLDLFIHILSLAKERYIKFVKMELSAIIKFDNTACDEQFNSQYSNQFHSTIKLRSLKRNAFIPSN